MTKVKLGIHCPIEQFEMLYVRAVVLKVNSEALSLSFLDTLIPYLPCLSLYTSRQSLNISGYLQIPSTAIKMFTVSNKLLTAG